MNVSIFSRSETLDLVRSTKNMPTLPDRFLKIRSTIANIHSDANDLAHIIETDIATSAAILKISNSASYNPSGKALASLPHAIARIGTATSAQIAMSMALLQGFMIPSGLNHIRKFWAHSYATAQICSYMCQQLTSPYKEQQATLFIAALLHDIGRAILAMRVDINYFDRDFSALCSQELCEAESETYGVDHTEVGAIILEHWGMPDTVIETVRRHHSPDTAIATNLCSEAEAFVLETWPSTPHIEEMQIIMKAPPHDDIMQAMQASEILKPLLQK